MTKPNKGVLVLVEKISPHLQKLARKSHAIARQFMVSSQEEIDDLDEDPLSEEEYTKVKGLVHKYGERALVLLTLNCAAYCRFCTRQRCVSEIEKGKIGDRELRQMAAYLKKNSRINEVILSGGDPLTVPAVLAKALRLFSSLNQIKIIRIGTLVPVSEPKLVNEKLLAEFRKVKQPLYVLVNFEHPDELTSATVNAIAKLRQAGAILLSQTVFLKGINDKAEILTDLFTRLLEIGVKPYYLFRCDPVAGAKRFIVPFRREIKIATELRRRLSGLAYPLYVIDAPYGIGKIPVPLDFWEFKCDSFRDFSGKKCRII